MKRLWDQDPEAFFYCPCLYRLELGRLRRRNPSFGEKMETFPKKNRFAGKKIDLSRFEYHLSRTEWYLPTIRYHLFGSERDLSAIEYHLFRKRWYLLAIEYDLFGRRSYLLGIEWYLSRRGWHILEIERYLLRAKVLLRPEAAAGDRKTEKGFRHSARSLFVSGVLPFPCGSSVKIQGERFNLNP